MPRMTSQGSIGFLTRLVDAHNQGYYFSMTKQEKLDTRANWVERNYLLRQQILKKNNPKPFN